MTKRIVAAGAFKQGCLAILDEVAEGNVEVVVTKRGRPVARLVAIGDPEERDSGTLARLRARGRGTLGRQADLLTPSSKLSRWNLLPGARSR